MKQFSRNGSQNNFFNLPCSTLPFFAKNLLKNGYQSPFLIFSIVLFILILKNVPACVEEGIVRRGFGKSGKMRV